MLESVRQFPTQRQIAEALGVSQTLVSRALSGRAFQIGASPRTVARIRRLAEKRGYCPHPAALALRGAPTQVLGVVVKDFEDPYFGRLIGCLQSEARRRGVSLLLTGQQQEDVLALQRNKVDAVILAGSDFRPQGLRRAVGPTAPIVQLGAGVAHEDACLVGMDEAAGIELLVGHLQHLRHRFIGFAGMETSSHCRRAAFAHAAVGSRGGTFSRFIEADAGALVAKISQVCSSDGRDLPTAIVAGDDMVALALNAGLAARGVLVPRDISIVGIDDIPAASLALPPLTTLAQPMPQMAAEALRLLLHPGEWQSSPPRLLPGSLVLRGSCAPLPN